MATANRFIASDKVTARLQSTLALFDRSSAGKSSHRRRQHRHNWTRLRVRNHTMQCLLFCGSGPMGASAFTGAIPQRWMKVLPVPAPIEVFNVLGSGRRLPALPAGRGGSTMRTGRQPRNTPMLRGARRIAPWLLRPAYRSWQELNFLLERGDNPLRRPRTGADPLVHNHRGNWR